MTKEWFATWFDSPWYPQLYSHRDDSEAQAFIQHMLRRLDLPANSHILDLACGQGRHARALHAAGYQVTGVDLSASSIEVARNQPAQGLNFAVGDMRELPYLQTFDAVLNLFTSFGYFARAAENLTVLRAVWHSLKPGGHFVLDFLSAPWVRARLVRYEEVQRDNVRFVLRRSIVHEKVRKDIHVIDPDHGSHDFYEQVQLFSLDELRNMLLRTGFTIHDVWGDYSGSPYRFEESPRCVIFAQKGTAHDAQ